ncbi:hypothetical protein GCM10022227_07670 [Streptomyces sedi]
MSFIDIGPSLCARVLVNTARGHPLRVTADRPGPPLTLLAPRRMLRLPRGRRPLPGRSPRPIPSRERISVPVCRFFPGCGVEGTDICHMGW